MLIFFDLFIFSGKKAASSSGDGSAPDDSSRYMQEINMGFEKLVAMASEVDKRRKSAENSPVQGQHGSPRKTGASDLRLTDASFDSSSLAAKFKAGLMQGQGASSQVNTSRNQLLDLFTGTCPRTQNMYLLIIK